MTQFLTENDSDGSRGVKTYPEGARATIIVNHIDQVAKKELGGAGIAPPCSKGFSITYYHFVKRLLIPDAHNKKLRMYESEDIVKKEPLDAAKQEPQDQATQKKLEDAVVTDPYLEGTVVTVQCLKPKEIAWEEPPDADEGDGPASVRQWERNDDEL